jgi:hypothetical protein
MHERVLTRGAACGADPFRLAVLLSVFLHLAPLPPSNHETLWLSIIRSEHGYA